MTRDEIETAVVEYWSLARFVARKWVHGVPRWAYEDAVYDAAMEGMYKALATWDATVGPSVAAWISVLVRQHALTESKHWSRECRRPHGELHITNEVLAPDNPESEVAAADLWEWMLATSVPKERATLLATRAGYSAKEIGYQLGVTREWARRLLTRTRARLAEMEAI